MRVVCACMFVSGLCVLCKFLLLPAVYEMTFKSQVCISASRGTEFYCHLVQRIVVVARTKPVPVHREQTDAAKTPKSKSPTMILFEISAMSQPAVEAVKGALRQKAEQMILTVSLSFEDLEELSKQREDELKSLQSTDTVLIDIGKLDLGCIN